jgi:hypothetical protein
MACVEEEKKKGRFFQIGYHSPYPHTFKNEILKALTAKNLMVEEENWAPFTKLYILGRKRRYAWEKEYGGKE